MTKRFLAALMAAALLTSLQAPALGGGGGSASPRGCKVAAKGAYACGLTTAGKLRLSETAGLGRIKFAPKGKLGAALQRDEGTVAILDMSRPDRPKVVGRYGTANVSLDGDLAFSSDGRWLFYARQTSDWDEEGVHVLDLADPTEPRLAGYAPAGGSYRVAYYEDDGGQWVVLLDAISGLVVYRFEPATAQLIPVHIDALPALKVGGPASAGIVIDPPHRKGDPPLMYVTTGRTGLQIFDLTDPMAPELLGDWSEVGLAEVVVRTAKKQRLAYVATEYWFRKDIKPEIIVLDVSDPGKIEERKRFSLGGDPNALYQAERIQGMRYYNDILYVAHSTLGLAVLDADTGAIRASARVAGRRNPEARVEVAPYAIDVEAYGGYLYLSDAATGIVTVLK